MQHGMHNTIELQRVELELRESALKYHYLVVDDRLRNRQPRRLSNLSASFRAFFAPRPILREEHGV
jgi:hypothetical protein